MFGFDNTYKKNIADMSELLNSYIELYNLSTLYKLESCRFNDAVLITFIAKTLAEYSKAEGKVNDKADEFSFLRKIFPGFNAIVAENALQLVVSQTTPKLLHEIYLRDEEIFKNIDEKNCEEFHRYFIKSLEIYSNVIDDDKNIFTYIALICSQHGLKLCEFFKTNLNSEILQSRETIGLIIQETFDRAKKQYSKEQEDKK